MKFFDLPNEPAKRKQRTKTNTVALEREEVPFELFTDEELCAAKGGVLVFDVECYVNYWLCSFRCFFTNKIVYFEITETQKLDISKLLWVIHNFCIVGFNSLKYDIIVVWLALTGASTETLKAATNFIITEKMRSQDIERMYGFKMGTVNHIDLIEVSPGKGSLKAYASRLHAPRLQELPFPPDSILTPDEQKTIRLYNFTDLEDTILLLKKLSPQLELRVTLSRDFGQDVRSLSDAQIAEAVICSEVSKKIGYYPKRPKIETGTIYKYSLPEHIRFQNPKLNEMLFEVANANFEIGLSKKDGQIVLSPKELEDRIVKIGNSEYRLGIGGIHSCEKSIAHYADDKTLLIDRDVESYYPRLILNQNLYPKHIGPVYLEVFDGLVESRLHDKHTGNKVGADSKKIVVNSTYGKLNDNWSRLRSPGDMIQVTLTGQLSLLMLIEMAELHGIPAVSANTDGIVFKVSIDKYDYLNILVSEWEKITRFKTEETRYKALYSANVNNYLAVKLKYDKEAKRWTDEVAGIKAKGWYADEGISKNPVNTICVEAVTELISKGTSVEETINNCKDVTKFVTCRNVKGGAEYNGAYLGKIIRMYMSKTPGTINYIMSGNKVPDSQGAKPLMDLNGLPEDVNREWYINKAVDILYKIGYYKREIQQKFF